MLRGVWHNNCREIPHIMLRVCQQEQNLPSNHGSEDKICTPPISIVPHLQTTTHRIHKCYDYLVPNLTVVNIAALAFKK